MASVAWRRTWRGMVRPSACAVRTPTPCEQREAHGARALHDLAAAPAVGHGLSGCLCGLSVPPDSVGVETARGQATCLTVAEGVATLPPASRPASAPASSSATADRQRGGHHAAQYGPNPHHALRQPAAPA